jgi:hypothetical protein
MRFQSIRRVSVVLFFVSAVISGLTLAAFVILAVLVFQERIDTKLLSSIAVEAHTGGFASLPIVIIVGAGLTVLCKRAQIPLRITGKYLWKAVWVIWFVVCLHVFLTPSRYVHPEGNAWISTGRAGPLAVSEQVARRYLWSEMEWSFLIVFGGSSFLALASRSVLQQARSLGCAAINKSDKGGWQAPQPLGKVECRITSRFL